MTYFFDTSALIKRYHTEQGTDSVDRIFDNPCNSIVICSISLAEVMSALNRIKNRGELTPNELEIALSTFYSDCQKAKIGIIDVKRMHIISCHNLIFSYNISSSDAIILACVLAIQRFNPTFVCADTQSNLIRAAQSVRLSVLNPLNSTE